MSELPTMIEADFVGRIGLVENDYGRPVTLMVCEGCGHLFTITGDHSVEDWGGAVCLGLDCSTYDVERDVDLTFEIEPWRIRRDDAAIGGDDDA
ncbi:hypothetical protein LCGC14_1860260 [marine sediment metagenome]|uniref:Uncharacterized protein n=1 Tax=marine sediment metagenome TaxID=412755 RepID=A0A0F9GW63_9ZZZZ